MLFSKDTVNIFCELKNVLQTFLGGENLGTKKLSLTDRILWQNISYRRSKRPNENPASSE